MIPTKSLHEKQIQDKGQDMRNKEEELDIELRILDAHYDKFHFGNVKIFISFLQDKESKSLVCKEYECIAKNHNHEVIFINNCVDLKKLLITPTLEQCYAEQDEKFFKNKTFIVDIDNPEAVPMITELRNISHHLIKKSQATLHVLSKPDYIREYLVGSDLWEFRTKAFDYPAGEIGKIKFKQMMESSLESKPSNEKKPKI